MALVWELELPDSEKLVLLALADAANDEGVCWPSMATLARKCTKSDRTVQTSIKKLIAAGHLTQDIRLGKGALYTVHPRSGFTPEAASPPKGTTSTPEAASDNPSRTAITQKASPSSSARKRKAAAKEHRGTRIPDDWTAPSIDTLEPQARVAAAQWPTGAYEAFAEEFRLFWTGQPGAKGKKLDWRGTWCGRIIDMHSKAMRWDSHEERARGWTHRPSAWAAKPGMAGREPTSLDDNDRRQKKPKTIGELVAGHRKMELFYRQSDRQELADREAAAAARLSASEKDAA